MNTDKEKLKYTPQEVFEWFQTKKFQLEQGHQEYQMIYEIDLPRIINQFISDKNLSVCDERIQQLEEWKIDAEAEIIKRAKQLVQFEEEKP